MASSSTKAGDAATAAAELVRRMVGEPVGDAVIVTDLEGVARERAEAGGRGPAQRRVVQ